MSRQLAEGDRRTAVIETARPVPSLVVLLCRLTESVGMVEVQDSDGRGLRSRSLDLGEDPDDRDAQLVLVLIPQVDGSETVEVRAGAMPAMVAPLEAMDADLSPLLRTGLARLPSSMREQVLTLLADATGWVNDAEAGALSRHLYQVREVLRERVPYRVIEPQEPHGLDVDAVLVVDERSFWIKGWARDTEAPLTRLTAVSPEGARAELLGQAFPYRRADVEQFYENVDGRLDSGFLGFVELPSPSRLATGWVLEMEDASGRASEVEAPPAVADPFRVRENILAVLGEIAREGTLDRELMLRHVHPALSRIQERLGASRVRDVAQFGPPPSSPEVSVVVPLYGRIDYLEHQLAQFVHDPELAGADLIYVLDSPELAEDLARRAAQLWMLYGLSFRVVTMERNVGYSGANEAGASMARGRLLLLLNSDVLPDRGGWLGTMTAFSETKSNLGALSPKLLYEDETLQHAGMYFVRDNRTGLWENRHYFKGLHRSFPSALTPRQVPAVTGACLMINRDLYERLGGLRGIYVQGDFEDSDLCLRLAEEGLESWYLPDAELYHLEAQSYPSDLRRLTHRYNAWLQTHLWNDRIEAMAEMFPEIAEESGQPITVGPWP